MSAADSPALIHPCIKRCILPGNKIFISTQSFFGKYFKQHTGYSPSRFKRKGS